MNLASNRRLGSRRRMTLTFWIYKLALISALAQKSFGCGAGAGGGGGSSGSSSQTSADEIGKSIFNIIQYLPGDYTSAFESIVIQFLNEQLAKAFGGDMLVSSYGPGGTLGRPISCPQDLNCNFERPCRWRNVREEDLTYFNGTGRPEINRFETLTGTKELPRSPYAAAAGNKGSTSAWLVSDPVPSQPGDGFVEFRYWLTPLLEMKVCTRQPDTTRLIFCTPAFYSANKPGPITVRIPGPISTPFEILFEMAHFVVDPGAVGIVDDITYSSTLCGDQKESSIRSAAKPPKEKSGKAESSSSNDEKQAIRRTAIQPTPLSGERSRVPGKFAGDADGEVTEPQDSSICQSLVCDFDGGSTCNYNPASALGTRPFRLQQGPVGNPLTGIRRDRFGNRDFDNAYVLAEGSSSQRTDIAVIESVPLELTEPVQIKFYRWQGSALSRLRVCVNSLEHCVKSYETVSRDWMLSDVRIEPNDLQGSKSAQILFVADGLTSNGYLAIDDIQLPESGCR